MERFEDVWAVDAPCPYLPTFVQNSKNVIRFVVRHFEIPDIELQKSNIITLTWFLGRSKVKNKGIGLKFCTLLVLICHLYNLYFFFTSSNS